MEGMFPEGAAIVFGGSGGIGRGVALEFARAGTPVAIVYRSKQDVAQAVGDEIADIGQTASIHAADVRRPEEVQDAIEATIAAHGRLHTVVWAAGPVADQVHLSQASREQWALAVDVEVHGFFNVVQATLPHLRERRGGTYVTLGSAGHLRWPDRDVLSVACKGANEQLVRAIARGEGRYEIRANSVLVGVIEAGMFLELTRRGDLDQQWVDETQKMLALKRWGKPADIGHAAVYLTSRRADYVTGQQIVVAGGFQL